MHQTFFRSRCAAALWVICTGLHFLATLSAHGAERTADEVLRRSKEAMMPPIRYRILSQGVHTVISQKILSDGAMAIRTETPSPVHRIALQIKGRAFEFYPDRGIGIDTTLVQESALNQAVALNQTLGSRAHNGVRLNEAVLPNGRACYEVVTTFSPELFSFIAAGLPEQTRLRVLDKTPREKHEFLDKQSFVPLQTRTLSASGTVLSFSELQGIEQHANLPDDLFLAPDGIELLKPRTTREYAAMLIGILTQRSEEFAVEPPVSRIPLASPAPLSSGMVRPEIDSRTGRILPGRNLPPPRLRESLLTAHEILRRAKLAMRPSIRYRLVRDGISSVVDQIALSNGKTATRVEATSPQAKISLYVDAASCEFYPDRGTGIDTSFLGKSFNDERLSIETAALEGSLDEIGLDEAKVGSIVLENGRRCFEIVAQHLSATSDGVLARIVIDRSSFELVETRTVSADGATISRIEWLDIQRPTDQYDKFMVPDGIEFSVPQEPDEYVAALANILQPKPRESLSQSDTAPIRQSRRRAVAKHISPSASVSKVGASRLTFAGPSLMQDSIASQISDARARAAKEPNPPRHWLKLRSPWAVGLVSVVSFALFGAFLNRQKLTTAASLRHSNPQGTRRARRGR